MGLCEWRQERGLRCKTVHLLALSGMVVLLVSAAADAALARLSVSVLYKSCTVDSSMYSCTPFMWVHLKLADGGVEH
jgi:hypothetical protein